MNLNSTICPSLRRSLKWMHYAALRMVRRRCRLGSFGLSHWIYWVRLSSREHLHTFARYGQRDHLGTLNWIEHLASLILYMQELREHYKIKHFLVSSPNMLIVGSKVVAVGPKTNRITEIAEQNQGLCHISLRIKIWCEWPQVKPWDERSSRIYVHQANLQEVRRGHSNYFKQICCTGVNDGHCRPVVDPKIEIKGRKPVKVVIVTIAKCSPNKVLATRC